MKLIEVPVFNEDGSVQFTQMCTPDEAKALLQFALNFLTAAGLQTHIMMSQKAQAEIEEIKVGLND